MHKIIWPKMATVLRLRNFALEYAFSVGVMLPSVGWKLVLGRGLWWKKSFWIKYTSTCITYRNIVCLWWYNFMGVGVITKPILCVIFWYQTCDFRPPPPHAAHTRIKQLSDTPAGYPIIWFISNTIYPDVGLRLRPLFRCQSQVQVVNCTSNQLSINRRFPWPHPQVWLIC